MNNTNKYGLLMVMTLLLTGLLSSCLKENFDDCPRPFSLFIKAIDIDQSDITASGQVSRVILFVFDENEQIVDAFELDEAAVKSRKAIPILLDYPGHESLSFVAWGNIDESVTFPAKASVKELSDLYVNLKLSQNTKSTKSIAQSPCDIFYGAHSAPVEYGGYEPAGDQTVVISRRTSQVAISAFALKKWNNSKEGQYSFELRESNSSIDKDGNLSGEMVSYRPTATMDTEGNLLSSVSRTLPTTGNKPYTLYILFNGEEIYSTDKDSEGNLFIPKTGQLLNIIIDFRASVSIKSIITPWNQVFQYVEI